VSTDARQLPLTS